MGITMEAGPARDLASLLKDVKCIASLPQVTAQIVKTIDDPNGDSRHLHDIILHDPALATRILKIVNSAFYGMPGLIGRIDRAIVILGVNGVRNIAIAASLGTLFEGASICDGFVPKDLWVHSIAVAVAARELARAMNIGLADEAFLAALIHDIGLLAALQARPDEVRAVCDAARRGEDDFCATERRVIGFDHQQVGAALLARWRFPRACQLAAGHHHDPQAVTDWNRQLLTLVHVADALCCQAGYGFNLTALRQSMDDASLVLMRLDPVAVGQARQRLDVSVSEAVALLG
jgi:putative nucleotidyltransferase with HDIG domain